MASSGLPVYDNGSVVATSQLVKSGQAIVYRGTKDGNQDVAIKVFKRNTSWDTSECRKEAMLLLRIPRHPHVMDLLAVYSKDALGRPKPCLVTRFIAGGDLRDCLNKRHTGFVGDNAIRLLKGIGEGVQHLHSNGIVHRDLKPENVLLEERNGALWPVLIDLALGKQVTDDDKSQFDTSRPKGTAHWVAPEMIRGCKWSDKTDMYALGIVMWEIFTGKVPYSHIRTTGALIRYVTDENGRPDMTRLSDEVSLVHRQLMQDLWHNDPKQRPTVQQFLDRLDSSGRLQDFLPLNGVPANEPDVDVEFLRGWSRDYVTMSMDMT